VTLYPPDLNLEALRLELSRRRAKRGWTYDQLAEGSGVARRQLIDIEQGKAVGTLTTWHRIAHALDVPMSTFTEALCAGHEPAGSHTGVKDAPETDS
jgi:transcriptional regulator with XRE-family HTH domain